MGSCKYLLEHNGDTMTFNSEQELASFITNNLNRLDSLIVDNNVKLSSEFNAQEEAAAKVKVMSNFAAQTSYDEFGNKIIKSPNRKSVTEAITTLMGENNKALVAGFDVKAFREYKISQLMEEYKLNSSEPLSDKDREDKANQAIDQMIMNWKTLAKMGTGIHAVMEDYFNNLGISQTELINSVREKLSRNPETAQLNINDNQLIQLIDFAKNVHKQIASRYSDSIIIPEIKIVSKDGPYQIVGKIDLLVIDKKGDLHVFDFKTSPTNYNDYNKVKNITHDYQLGFYRQILGQYGFNIKNMDLGIIPIQMLDADYQNNTFSGISEEAELKIKSDPNVDSRQGDLHYSGKIASQLNNFIPVNSMKESISTEMSDSIKKIDSEIFGYSSKNRMTVHTLEKFIENSIHKGADGKFGFRDNLIDQFRRFDSLEKATEAAKKYLAELTEKDLSLASVFSKEYHKLEDLEDPNDRIFPETVTNYSLLNKYLSNYLKWGYKLNDSLLAQGVLTFYHPTMKTVDFIYVNKNDLEIQQKFRNERLITGNLIFDRQAPSNTLKATNGNIELMRLMAAVNEFMPEFSDNGFKVNDLKVINFATKKSAIQTTDVLKENWKHLIHAANREKGLKIVNNFENGKIQTVSGTEKVLNQLEAIINSREAVIPPIKKFKKNIKTFNDSVSNEWKIKQLVDLLTEIKENRKADDLISPVKGANTNDTDYLYYLVANAIRELSGLKYIYSLTDLDPKAIHSDLWMDTAHSPNQMINEVNNKVIEKLRVNSRERMHKDLTPIKLYTEKWLKEKGKIDSALNSFDHLIEKNDENQIFQVKNPYSDPSITGSDKEFLINWLKTVNNIRYPSTKGDHNSEAAKALIANGKWFNIPLMRGTAVNRGISWNTVKNWWKDKTDEAVNVMETLTQPQMTETGKQEHLFETFVNPMMTDGEGVVDSALRDNLLIDKKVNYFSRDLADIAATFTYYNILSDEYERALPVLRTALICAHAGSLFTGADVSGMLTTMMEKFQTSVYKTQHMTPTEKAIAKVYAPISAMASMITLPFNTASFVNELLQGTYNNYGRALTKYGGKDAPNGTNLTKGYAFVTEHGAKSAFNETLMNAFNLRYGIFGRSLEEQKTSHRGERNPVTGQVFKSGSLYWLNGLSDYMHRMALFAGHIYEGGFMEAYSVDNETGELKYDFNKDPRFENVREYLKGGKLKAGDTGLERYNMMLEAFNSDIIDDHKKLKFGDPLPDGFAPKQITSIQNLANLIHGNLDSDTQMHARTYLAGKVFLKFINFIGSKATAWTLSGGKYSLVEPKYETDPETGNPLYIKVVKDEQGNVVGTTTTTDYNDSTGQKVVLLDSRYEVGAMYAFKDLYNVLTASDSETRKKNWENLKEDDHKMASLQFHIADLFLFLMAGIAAAMIDWPELKKENGTEYLMAQAMRGALSANNPISIVSTVMNGLDPAALKVNTKLLNNTFKFATNDDYELKQYLANTLGAGKILNLF